MRHLLGINVWIALFDDAHALSNRANDFIDTPGLRIATCPLVENRVIRVMNLPGYGRRVAVGLKAVRDRLAFACRQLDHAFWLDDVSLRDDRVANFDRLHGHNQVTDAYLLALAVAHGGVLTTFDQGIPLNAVPGATQDRLLVL